LVDAPEHLRRSLVIRMLDMRSWATYSPSPVCKFCVAQSLSNAKGFLAPDCIKGPSILDVVAHLRIYPLVQNSTGERIERGRVCILDPWILDHFVSIGSRRDDIKRWLARNSLHHFTSHVQVHPTHAHDEPLLH